MGRVSPNFTIDHDVCIRRPLRRRLVKKYLSLSQYSWTLIYCVFANISFWQSLRTFMAHALRIRTRFLGRHPRLRRESEMTGQRQRDGRDTRLKHLPRYKYVSSYGSATTFHLGLLLSNV